MQSDRAARQCTAVAVAAPTQCVQCDIESDRPTLDTARGMIGEIAWVKQWTCYADSWAVAFG